MALAGDHVQVLVGGYELTGDMNRINLEDSRDMLMAPSFGDVVKKSIPGLRYAKVSHAGYMNAAAGKSHPVLRGVSVNGIVSVLLGQNAAPAVGDPVYSVQVEQGRYMIRPQFNQVIPFSAEFVNRVVGEGAGWGKVLAPPTTFTNTTNGSSVDNGAATTNGASGFLHILTAAASDTYSIILQGSTTGAFSGEETTVTTFSQNGSAIGSERKTVSGTIPRYLRWRAVRTGSAGNTVKIAVALIRL
jgi:hypothetical protein